MEMSVGFTVEDDSTMISKGYVLDKSELGKVFYPDEGIVIQDKIIVKYVDYPWISCFEVEGIEILKTQTEEQEYNDFPFGNFDDILYSSDNESGGNKYVSDIESSIRICGSE